LLGEVDIICKTNSASRRQDSVSRQLPARSPVEAAVTEFVKKHECKFSLFVGGALRYRFGPDDKWLSDTENQV
jgi:hypothetical protein